MGYDEAMHYFEENANLIRPPQSDIFQWNLNAGLARLTEALRGDIAEIQDDLGNICSALQLPR